MTSFPFIIPTPNPLLLLLLILLLSLFNHSLPSASSLQTHPPSSSDDLPIPSDASALLSFKSGADLHGLLNFSTNSILTFCHWPGVVCLGTKVVRLLLQSLPLHGVVSPNTLTRLDQLRVLCLQNDSLSGPIPDLSGLLNLKALFLDHNSFYGFVPPSISTLHRLRTLDLSHNDLAGPIPSSLIGLARLYYLRLDSNRFNGSIPPLNQSTLQVFNVSRNALTGAIPVTPALVQFGAPAFSGNPGLCGEIVHKECVSVEPFFGSSSRETPPPRSPASLLGERAESMGGGDLEGDPGLRKRTTRLIVGFSSGVFFLVCSLLCFAMAFRKYRAASVATPRMATDSTATADAEAVMRMEEENELEEKVKEVQGMQVVGKSGSLSFCAGEAHLYSLDQLMRASAELLGRGTAGTTYKAVLDNRLIVTVKRLDAARFAGAGKEVFQRHVESVGGLRHPNLVPLRAYFQAKEERLLIFDYQPNGSLSSLIHGSNSVRAKPLHWTSCLKIAEDVAQGLCYIHQAWRLVHGNLKASNVLLGPDFEACVTDYCLSTLSSAADEDPDSASYRAPESRNPGPRQPTPRSDVYSFGVLLLELLSGRPPSHHPNSAPDEMVSWLRSSRDDDGVGDYNRLLMLLEVAMVCRTTSPEQRPTMWRVMKMIQEVKEVVTMEDSELDLHVDASI